MNEKIKFNQGIIAITAHIMRMMAKHNRFNEEFAEKLSNMIVKKYRKQKVK